MPWSVGVGLLIGWAVGLIIAPVVGFGVCVALLNVSVAGIGAEVARAAATL